ncbi:hypothetical protein QTO34_019596 [Cnephaeus nilssonii]|uniref:Coiled-coil domain containing 32 n=1 Tax=Cnephaeus nilssonii TaxID=3371016 RepID=A0AA40HWX6_CNENI|nr:hypothetical protein QTO34_019596 [Eptesicus nilssonii]
MKMFESIDSTATKSGPDLWAEICSCLPNPDQEDGIKMVFANSYLYSDCSMLGEREISSSLVWSMCFTWGPRFDSAPFLLSLENKLRRIKGLNQEVTSKDMLRTLAQAKKECWDRFLQEKLASEFFVDGLDSDESTLEHFKRWLQPDKVAISTEEVQYLIPPESQVEKPVAEDEPAAAEQ